MEDHHSSTSLQARLTAMAGMEAGAALRSLVAAGLDRLPFPGQGATLARWRALAAVGFHDLGLAKLYEGHTDALAILHEAGASLGGLDALWGTWCAEPPDARLLLQTTPDGGVLLSGRKAWCSGAQTLSHAVVSCWNEHGEAVLAALDLRQDGVRVTGEGWHAVGMRASSSVDVEFDRAAAIPLGAPGFYVARPGFWHGGAGVAACWFGGATRLAGALRARLAGQADPHRLAQLGDVTVALGASAARMREAAAAIDRAPMDNAMLAALSVRLCVEASATATLAAAGRALGAGPLCKDPAIASLFADLPVFMRQSHAERDLEAVGRLVAAAAEAPWTL